MVIKEYSRGHKRVGFNNLVVIKEYIVVIKEYSRGHKRVGLLDITFRSISIRFNT